MKHSWITTLRFDRSRCDWVGRVNCDGIEFEISSKYYGRKRMATKKPAPPEVVNRIEDTVADAIDAYPTIVAEIAAPFAQLYNANWRGEDSRRLSGKDLKELLRVQSLHLDQGDDADQIRICFQDPELFGGHFPFVSVESGELRTVGLESPRDPNGMPTLPFPGVERMFLTIGDHETFIDSTTRVRGNDRPNTSPLVERLLELGAKLVGSPISNKAAALDWIDAKYNLQIPADYRSFLLVAEGSIFLPAVCHGLDSRGGSGNVDSFDVTVLYGLTKDGESDGLLEALRSYHHRLPKGVLPIGDTTFGDQICMNVQGRRKHCVYLWDHHDEREITDDDENDYGNMYPLAESFADLISVLRVEE